MLFAFSISVNAQEFDRRVIGLADYAPDPERSADSIIILRPDIDISAVTVEEIVIKGEILKVEKGLKPDVIIRNANTLIRPLNKGVAVKMFLKQHLEREAYYPIAIFSVKSEAKL